MLKGSLFECACRKAGIVFVLVFLLVSAGAQARYHSADITQDFQISLSELLRGIQFFNSGGLHCEEGTEDGYAPGPGSTACFFHDSDYNPSDWLVNLSELLRLIQFFNSGGYHPEAGTEDGFGAGLPTGEGEGGEEGLIEGEGLEEGEGLSEGEGLEEGEIEGALEGIVEGEGEGGVEGLSEGEGIVEGEEEGIDEGQIEGTLEGIAEGEEEGGVEGMNEGEGEIVLPSAAFDASPRSGRVPVIVQFEDLSSPGSSPITDWSWDFGDGGTSTEQSPAHEYTVWGVYSVTLTVETEVGADELTQSSFITAYAQDVIINEFLASNASNIQDEDSDYSDWIELYNPNLMAVPLANWSLTDSSTSPAKWVFPAITIPAGGYLVVFASGKDRKPVDGSPLHTNFKMNANDPDTPGYGEYLALFNTETPPRATTLFNPAFPTQTADISFGLPEGGMDWCFFPIPTPWDANGLDCTPVEGEGGVEGSGEGEGMMEGQVEGEGETGLPVAAFSASPRSGRVPLTVHFVDMSTAGFSAITSWTWDFGDGGFSEDQYPDHEYTIEGVYTVTLTVEAPEGSDEETRAGYITVYAQDVVINEFLASNATVLQDEDLEYSDWIELHNPNSVAVPMANWALTDNAAYPDKWVFPDISIAAGGYLVVFASSKDRKPTDGRPLHTNFKMNADDPDTPGFGEYLALFNAEMPPRATTQFDPAFPSQATDISYGLQEGGVEWCFYSTPTAGAANGADCTPKVAPVVLNYTRGYYDAPIGLTMTCPTPEAHIRYTLDGTVPTESGGNEYEGIPLDLISPAIVRVSAFKEGYNSAALQTHTYLIGVDEVLKALPVISIVADPQESLYEPNGIWAIAGGEYVPPDDYGTWQPVNEGDYNNVLGRGSDYERPASVEYFCYDAQNCPGFQVNCGMRVHGGDYYREHFKRALDWTKTYGRMSYGLFFRDEYGPTKLEYPLFGDIEVQEFDQLVLRGGHGDAHNPFFKDEYTRRLFGDCGYVYAHGMFAHLFVNGEYKGYINPVEHYDSKFFQSWYGGDNGWDIIRLGGVEEGSRNELWMIIYLVQSFDVSDPLVYEDVCIKLDVVNFIDYLILELYAANWDWPTNNWTAVRERKVGGQFRFYVWDGEQTFDPYNLYQNGFIEKRHDRPWEGGGLNNDPAPVGIIFRGLKQNPDFRQLFSDRAYALFGPGGPLSQENLMARYTELYNELSPVIPDIETYIGDVWIPQRQEIFFGYLQEEGLLEVR